MVVARGQMDFSHAAQKRSVFIDASLSMSAITIPLSMRSKEGERRFGGRSLLIVLLAADPEVVAGAQEFVVGNVMRAVARKGEADDAVKDIQRA